MAEPRFGGENTSARPVSEPILALKVGERVKVKSLDEILATLDAAGRLDAMPFMPEMIAYCGLEFTVFKRIDKINDTVDRTGLRRMTNAVTLDGVRCSGAAHGGCQELCTIIWKEAWLQRVNSRFRVRLRLRRTPNAPAGGCTAARLTQMTRQADGEGYSCQATQLKAASSYLAWWDPRQYVRDWWSGNVPIGALLRAFGLWVFLEVVRRIGFRVLVPLYNAVQKRRGGFVILGREGALKTTPNVSLNLQPGEVVRIKSHAEIVSTLDTRNRNRGLWFDEEMVKYCGQTRRVLSRVERVIDHTTGKMLHLSNECILLEGVVVVGDHHRFHTHYEYPMWREIWLERVAASGNGESKTRERTQARAVEPEGASR
jgi:hypothetical protein